MNPSTYYTPFKFFKVFTSIALVFCASFLFAQNENNIFHISFGENNQITYKLKEGIYDVSFNSLVEIQNVSAVVKGNVEGNSQTFKYQSHSKEKFENGFGKGLKYTIVRSNANGIKMLQEFYVFANKNYFFIRLKII